MTFEETAHFHNEGDVAVCDIEDPKHERDVPMAVVGGSGLLAVEQTIKAEKAILAELKLPERFLTDNPDY